MDDMQNDELPKEEGAEEGAEGEAADTTVDTGEEEEDNLA